MLEGARDEYLRLRAIAARARSAVPEGLRVSEVQQVDAARGWRMVLRRFSALLAGEAGARILGFVIVLILATRLGPAGFGIVTFGLTLVAWCSYVVDAGTEILDVREIARRPDRFREISERVLGLRLALSVSPRLCSWWERGCWLARTSPARRSCSSRCSCPQVRSISAGWCSEWGGRVR